MQIHGFGSKKEDFFGNWKKLANLNIKWIHDGSSIQVQKSFLKKVLKGEILGTDFSS